MILALSSKSMETKKLSWGSFHVFQKTSITTHLKQSAVYGHLVRIHHSISGFHRYCSTLNESKWNAKESFISRCENNFTSGEGWCSEMVTFIKSSLQASFLLRMSVQACKRYDSFRLIHSLSSWCLRLTMMIRMSGTCLKIRLFSSRSKTILNSRSRVEIESKSPMANSKIVEVLSNLFLMASSI